MPEKTYGYIDLPSDPKDLTREHALKVFACPEVLVEAFARLTPPPPHTVDHATAAETVLAKAQG